MSGEGSLGVKVRPYLTRCLRAGAFLLIGLAVAGSLWGLLAVMGDSSGARVAKGISLGLAICLAFDLAALVVLIAIGQVSSREAPAESASDAGD